jgi:tetratricopeptide (TPR) repeat protein
MPLTLLAFEHRMYLPSAALMTLVVIGGYVFGKNVVCQKLSRRVGLAAGIGLVLLAAVALGFLTIRRNEFYRDPVSIWEDTISKSPHNHRAHLNYGKALGEKGRTMEALEQFQQALQLAPDSALAHYNMGFMLDKLGRLPEAIEHYQEAIRIWPDYAPAYRNCGSVQSRLGRFPDAIANFEASLRLEPENARAHNSFGNALSGLGRFSEAIEHYQAALGIAPEFAEAHYNLANTLSKLGRFPPAVAEFEQALRLKPDHADAHYNLSQVLSRMGRGDEAIDHATQAVRLRPKGVQANRFLAWLLATHKASASRSGDEAVELAERACSLTGRKDVACLDTLAAAYASAGRFDEAVPTAKEAWQKAQAAGQTALAEEIHVRLQLYRDRKPYREPVAPPRSCRP